MGEQITMPLLFSGLVFSGLVPNLFFDDSYRLYIRGVKLHSKRNLGKAFKFYRKALEKKPAKEVSENEKNMIFKYAPILLTTPTEPFPLRDVVAIMHPKLPLIAYHFFWEDDIDYPLDQEPCDHEIVWVLLDNDREKIDAIFTYFHGKVIRQEGSDVSTDNGHPIISVQWGKHGSLFQGWESFANGELLSYMKDTFNRLKNEGARNKDAPLSKKWPSYFNGGWKDFTDFSQMVKTEDYLKKSEMISSGLYANAIIKWYFLHYNFNPKYSWPKIDSSGWGIW